MADTMAINREWLNRLIVLSLCAMIFTLPFSKSAVEICIAVTFTLWALNRALSYDSRTPLISAFKPVDTRSNLPIYLFMIAGFLSILFSASISLSLKGFFSKLLKGVAVYFIAAETINDRKKLNSILIAMALSMLLIGIDGIFQFVSAKGRDFLRDYIQAGRVTASFSSSNGFGAWLTVMLPLAFGFICMGHKQRFKKTTTFILLILAGILTFCLILTRSRGALIGSVFATAFFFMHKKKKMFLVFLTIVLAISLFSAVYFMNTHLSFNGDFLISAKNELVQTMLKTDIVRTHLWREALLIIKDFPVFGCGLNTYSIVAPGYKSGLAESGIYPHNSYLQMAAETGVVGLGSFIFVMVSLFTMSFRNMKKIKDRFYSNILLGLLAGLFGFLAHSFLDVNFYALQLAVLMWFVMGLIVAVQRIALKEEGA